MQTPADFRMYQGLMDTAKNRGFEGEGYSYLTNPIWWAGMVTSKAPWNLGYNDEY